jgi:uncharacterized protein YcaQ
MGPFGVGTVAVVRRAERVVVSVDRARRLALESQGFPHHRRRTRPRAPEILRLIERLGYLQLDPTNVVARSHYLVLWSRFGAFDTRIVDRMLERDRRLFEYWAHAAAIVPASDYAYHHHFMQQGLATLGPWGKRAQRWLDQNQGLRQEILARIRADGPLGLDAFEGRVRTSWTSNNIEGGRYIDEMLSILWLQGEVAVARRKSGHRVWELADRHYSGMRSSGPIDPATGARHAVERAMGALGIATSGMIAKYSFAGHFRDVPAAIRELVDAGGLVPVQIESAGTRLSGHWFSRSEDIPALLATHRPSEWDRSTLLSPFDSLIAHRARTEALFGLRYRIEIYTPREKRIHGYFALPILVGDQIVGTLEPSLDRTTGTLRILQGHSTPAVPVEAGTGGSINQAVHELAAFVGARRVAYGNRLPKDWRASLRGGPVQLPV